MLKLAQILESVRDSFFFRAFAKLFSGWEAKEKIVRPVVVNLLTAFLLFLVAVAFKEPIYDYFSSPRAVRDWPIYCALEPQPNSGEEVRVDLFVINVDADGKKYYRKDLADLAKIQSPENGRAISPVIHISMKDYLLEESISDIKPDEEYNKEKGSVAVNKLDSAHWDLEIVEIKPNAILKFTILTTERREISSRASVESLPVKMSYARSQRN